MELFVVGGQLHLFFIINELAFGLLIAGKPVSFCHKTLIWLIRMHLFS
jgi:hypothetical protein